jgi:hypothetical protein
MDYNTVNKQLTAVTDHAPAGILKPGQNFDNHIGHSVVNISDYILSETQVSILSKGLTFCPTTGYPDLSEIWLDFKDFHRRLELTQFFSLQANALDNENKKRDPFTPKSTWKPPIPNKTLEAFKRAFRNDLLNFQPKFGHSNITKIEWDSLRDLTNNKNIIIKKADKGSAVVVMNTTESLTILEKASDN